MKTITYTSLTAFILLMALQGVAQSPTTGTISAESDFCRDLKRVINEFPNNFAGLLGQKVAKTTAFSEANANTFKSLLQVSGMKESSFQDNKKMNGMAFGGTVYYRDRTVSREQAEKSFEQLRSEINNCQLPFKLNEYRVHEADFNRTRITYTPSTQMPGYELFVMELYSAGLVAFTQRIYIYKSE